LQLDNSNTRLFFVVKLCWWAAYIVCSEGQASVLLATARRLTDGLRHSGLARQGGLGMVHRPIVLPEICFRICGAAAHFGGKVRWGNGGQLVILLPVFWRGTEQAQGLPQQERLEEILLARHISQDTLPGKNEHGG